MLPWLEVHHSAKCTFIGLMLPQGGGGDELQELPLPTFHTQTLSFPGLDQRFSETQEKITQPKKITSDPTSNMFHLSLKILYPPQKSHYMAAGEEQDKTQDLVHLKLSWATQFAVGSLTYFITLFPTISCQSNTSLPTLELSKGSIQTVRVSNRIEIPSLK
ncbi:ankyrin repeat and SOCS box protein 8 [Platysternon megacephalum]|uniref:Ankyrin repeat and SOCS box protein 8 n=1 Tax=Platysternon megacephalum TaxID=55544 RepID=A0A4D9E317_9SAUR|nr:ankyrin repeat and SOCS box protein 8 [Platysternon megacephalum]